MEVQALAINSTLLKSPTSTPTPSRGGPAKPPESVSLAQETASTEIQTSREAQLIDAVKATNEFIKPINSAVQFSLDSDSGKTVVRVMDISTEEVIRQIPSEEMLAIAKALDQIQGLLIRQKA